MIEFTNTKWKTLFEQNDLESFDALWDLQADWFEEPNHRRGGWSGVSRIELQQTDGSKIGIFLKRQQNHTRRTFTHPIKGENTFTAEVRNIKHLIAHDVPTLELICHGRQTKADKRNALLATVELVNYQPLSTLIQPEHLATLTIPQRRAIAQAVGEMTRKFHLSQRVHNCLYPKHIFVHLEGEDVAVRVIDVEKARYRHSALRRTLRDLDSLNRHAPNISKTDRLHCLLAYLEQQRMDKNSKQLWYKLTKLMKK